jgi:opacity protein-like surface antigen
MYKVLIAGALCLLSCTALAEPYAKVAVGWAYLPHNRVALTTKDDSTIIETNGNGSFISGALGAGASFKNNFRSDVELYIDDGIKSQKQYKNSVLNFKIKTLAVFANISYDLKNNTKYTPFVTGGIGYARNKTAITSCTKLYHRSNNNFAYQIGTGVGYALTKDVTLEVAYKFIDKGIRHQNMVNNDRAAIKNHKSSGRLHTLSLGCRIAL